MRVIKSDSGFLAYQKIFRHVVNNHSEMVVWQSFPDTGNRKVSTTFLNSFHVESALLHMDRPDEHEIDPNLPVYCYSENGQFIFKSEARESKSNILNLALPAEIHLLEEAEITLIRGQIGLDLGEVWRTKKLDIDAPDEGPDYVRVKSMAERSSRDQEFLNNEFNLSLDQEDQMFADKRESPRARPKIEKLVKVMVGSDPEIRLVRLFDLSRGGIGFITDETQAYPKGSEIRVVGFEDFDLDDPLIGKIMSQRPIDDSMVEYKIGVKFNEGQD